MVYKKEFVMGLLKRWRNKRLGVAPGFILTTLRWLGIYWQILLPRQSELRKVLLWWQE
jgi:hypothetical protein